MMSRHWIATLSLTAAAAVGALAMPARTAPAGGSPVVVELFQSQGCSSCPPANANLNAIADRPDLIPLSFAVTYWDQLGWKDTFAKPQFTARQWDYARTGGRSEVATPQIVINGGRTTVVGNDRRQLEAAISAARRTTGPSIAFSGDRVTIGSAGGVAPSTVWVVRYDPRVNQVPIRAGENGGRTLPHRNIVRQLAAVGTWSGRAATFALPPSPSTAYRTAVIVQSGKGGPIVASGRS